MQQLNYLETVEGLKISGGVSGSNRRSFHETVLSLNLPKSGGVTPAPLGYTGPVTFCKTLVVCICLAPSFV
jgi:hypothetical protein